MDPRTITRDEVFAHGKALPGFPSVITQIIAMLDDPQASTDMLVGHIERDPVIAARVLSLANAAAKHTRRMSAVGDIFTATSLIGLNSVREIALISSVTDFFKRMAPAGMTASFWQHGVAVGVCCEELATFTTSPASSASALIAGLLHDVGQLWLSGFDAKAFRESWNTALGQNMGIEDAELEHFGVDHSTIGAWLAEYWSLPADISAAIRHHHQPDAVLAEPLVPLVHIAEVLSNALDLTSRDENRVTSVSSAACQALDLHWDESVRPLFGRMEARSRLANSFFCRN